MRTVFLSDLHLGPGGPYDIFAATEGELVQFLDQYAQAPTRVVLNGDAVDFLLSDAPLVLDTTKAVSEAQAIANNPTTAAVFQALGRVLAAGGELLITIGNHDVELALGEVQEVLRAALAQPPEVSARLRFFRSHEPLMVEMGEVKVLVTHGQHNDIFNRVDWSALPGPGAPEGRRGKFEYPPGSILVKSLLNPLKRDFKMRFMDLLKPDFQGAVLTGLAVNADAVKVAWSRGTASLLYHLFKVKGQANTFAPGGEDDVDLGLARRLAEAGFTPEEMTNLEEVLGAGSGAQQAQAGPVAFSDDEGGWLLSGVIKKLGRAGLARYAAHHQAAAKDLSLSTFSTEPDKEEWEDAQRLADKYKAHAVIIGHTHAARWRANEGLAYLNTGTWIGLMRLPFYEYADGGELMDYEEYIDELRQNPQLLPEKSKKIKVDTRFTAGVLDEVDGQVELSLVEWRGGENHKLGSCHLPLRAP